MSASALNQLLSTLKVQANIFHNGQYCGTWAVDTSGANLMTFHVVTRGKCSIDIEGKNIQLSVGDAVFMPTDAPHVIQPANTNPKTDTSSSLELAINQATSYPMLEPIDEALHGEVTGLVCGHFTHKHPIINRLLKQLPNAIVVKHNRDTTTSQIIELILNESKSSGQSTNFLLNRLSDALFYVLIRDNISAHNGVFAALNHPKLSKPLEFIHNNFDQNLSVEVLAKQAGMSRSSFAALFKQVVELTPADYITQWRMTQAYRWLADEKISTYDAALRCSYESESSFSKAFKRIIGIGPGEARQQDGIAHQSSL